MATHPISALSICTGLGGLDLGLELAIPGVVRPLCYVEREITAATRLAALMDAGAIHPAPIWSDLRTLCEPDFRDFMGAALGGERLGLLFGGYPCQDFSTAGKRKGLAGSRGALWHSVAAAVELYRPRLVFFENVAAHLSLGFDQVWHDLDRLGYRVAAGLFTASEVGAPHRRERLFILGVAEEEAQDVGHAEGRRGQGCGVSARRGPEGPRTPQPDGRGAELADAEDCEREGQQEALSAGIKRIGEKPGYPLFPPGPGERERWAAILERFPELAPATAQPDVRRMADELAHRLDRLRILGNGVVPLAAAYAFCSLWTDLAITGGTP